MHKPLKGTGGCWTCRLRKKKCDEARPQCHACGNLSITCYGYGAKPEWMDGGDKEKSIANDLKDSIRHAPRRKAGSKTRLMRVLHELAPKASKTPSASPPQDEDVTQVRTQSPASSDGGNSSDRTAPFDIPAEDSVLVMFFLDKVFPSQFPMYNPDMMLGGRGWLLALLLRTKPLYHAATTLSSYYWKTLICASLSEDCRAQSAVKIKQRLDSCLRELQSAVTCVTDFIRQTDPSHGMATGACIIQLVFLELFSGQDGAWFIHLNAACHMYTQSCHNHPDKLCMDPTSLKLIAENLPVAHHLGARVFEEVLSFRFVSGAIFWLDIIASITQGKAPKLSDYHEQAIHPTSEIKLEDIMGCQNWAMILIGRISALHERQKAGLIMQGDFDSATYAQKAAEIRQTLENRLASDCLENLEIADGSRMVVTDSKAHTTNIITNMYVHAGLIYLHTVVHGFYCLGCFDNVNTAITKAVCTLQHKVPLSLLPALVAPLFIIGCVARPGNEQQYFRQLFTSSTEFDPLYSHRARLLSVLEETWKHTSTPGYSWDDVLNLAPSLLLV